MNYLLTISFKKKVVYVNISCFFYNENQFITKAIDMHNFYAKYAKILDISKHLSKKSRQQKFSEETTFKLLRGDKTTFA